MLDSSKQKLASESQLSRRDMLRQAGIALGSLAIAGCTTQPSTSNGPVSAGVPVIPITGAAYKQSVSGTGNGTNVSSNSFSQPTTQGGFLVMGLALDTPQSPPSPAGWGQVLADIATQTSMGFFGTMVTNELQLIVYTYPDAPAMTSVSGITLGMNSNWALIVLELSPASGSTAVVVDASGITASTATGSTASTSTGPTTNANDELLAFIAYDANHVTATNQITYAGGFANGVINDVGNTGNVRLNAAQTTATSSGIQTVSGKINQTMGGAGDWVAALLALYTP